MSAPSQRLYSVDTSAIIDWLEVYYPPAHFPGLIDRVDELIDQGRFFISEEVWREAASTDQMAKQWCARRKDSIVVPTDSAVTAEAGRILERFPGLANPLSGKGSADPFVIAIARLRAATVVTSEGSSNAQRPKIPFVCKHLGIPCCPFIGVIQAERWSFS